MKRAWARLGVMSIIFGLFFFISVQILFADMMAPGILQLPAVILIILGVVSLLMPHSFKARKVRSQKPSLLDFL